MKEGGYERRRERLRPLRTSASEASDLTLSEKVRDLIYEIDDAYRRKLENRTIPKLDDLIQWVINEYGFEPEKASRIIEETVRIVRDWKPPETIGNIIPSPRELAIDSIRPGEAENLRKIWGLPPLKSVMGADPFRTLLISCRAFLTIEAYPVLYHERKVSSVRQNRNE